MTSLLEVRRAYDRLSEAIEIERQSIDLERHDFQTLGIYRNINDETRLMAADLAVIRLKKLWVKHKRIFLKPEELHDLWPSGWHA